MRGIAQTNSDWDVLLSRYLTNCLMKKLSLNSCQIFVPYMQKTDNKYVDISDELDRIWCMT